MGFGVTGDLDGSGVIGDCVGDGVTGALVTGAGLGSGDPSGRQAVSPISVVSLAPNEPPDAC